MSGSVLYDAPGPQARLRNLLYSLGFIVVAALVAWWVVRGLSDKNQLDWNKWSPFFTDSRVWTTYLLPGLVNTLKAAALAMALALPLGAALGIARLSEHAWLRWAAGTVVEFFRAIPVLMLMAFASAFYAVYTEISSDLRPLYAVVTGLVLYNASVLAEVFRAGILALPQGQTDAAKAIGMRKSQTMLSVLLPQSVTAMLPAIVSQLVVIVKDTALGGALLGYAELISKTRPIYGNYGANVIATLTVIAAVFIVLNFLLTSFAGWLERRLRRARRRGGTVLAAAMDEQIEGPGQPVPAASALRQEPEDEQHREPRGP
ncbi:amino acid ABC transporter permease [Streptomyces sp. YIM 98790]|uniref:amino acid ABC transporter permease n=1 Tax=Streptomyces sp. YIM 98790 TaxID=2689077 RepID=UPI0014073FA8|nr:ABC transporter permease subunit [Streptomyces sp. YIM 98790]